MIVKWNIDESSSTILRQSALRGARPMGNPGSMGSLKCSPIAHIHAVDCTWHLLSAFEIHETDLYIPKSLGAFAIDDQTCLVYRRVLHPSLVRNGSSFDSDARARGDSNTTSSLFNVTQLTLGPIARGLGSAEKRKKKRLFLHSVSQVQTEPPRPANSSFILNRDHCKAPVPQIIASLQSWPPDLHFSLGEPLVDDGAMGLGPALDEWTLEACLQATRRIKEAQCPCYISKYGLDTYIYEHKDAPGLDCALPFRSRVPVAVTGGTGGISNLLGHWLGSQGAETIFFSRNGFHASYSNLLKCAGSSASLSMVMDDVAAQRNKRLDMASSHKIFIMHAAGSLRDQSLNQVDMRSLKMVLAPKQCGTKRLAGEASLRATSGIVQFGSAAMVVGNASQASYIMANAVLHMQSRLLVHLGVPSVVAHWGPWRLQDGMATMKVQKKMQKLGVPLLDPTTGLDILQHVIERVAYPRQSGIAMEYLAMDINGLGSGEDSVPKHKPLMPSGNDLVHVDQTIKSIVHQVIGVEIHDSTKRFVEMGLDSMSSAEFAQALSSAFDMHFNSTVVFDYPSIKDLSSFISETAISRPDDNKSTALVQSSHLEEMERGSLRVDMLAHAHRFPKPSSSLRVAEEAWIEGYDLQSLTPHSRWDVERHYSAVSAPGSSYVRFGGWLDDVETFEGRFFSLLPDEVLTLDPQIRILLELTLEVRAVSPLAGSTSSFVGVMYNEYLDSILGPAGIADKQPSSIISNGMSFMVGRISYHHGLGGSAVACDTACSSSLVATHMSVQSILREDAPTSLAHGINLMLSPLTTSRICLIGALSSEGRCKTADSAADGYGRSEAGSTILLAPSTDPIGGLDAQAVILGSSIAHNGTSGGLTAPHGPSQAKLMMTVARQRREGPAHGPLASLHGTGTPLGDPIEFAALQSVKKQISQQASGPTIVLSTKACTGHMEGTAGLCGLILPLINSRDRIISSITQCRNLNKHIEKQMNSKICIPRQKAPLPVAPGNGADPVYPAFGTSSFGMSGINAHLACSAVSHHVHAAPKHEITWRKERHWPLIPQEMLAVTLRFTSRSAVVMACSLSSSAFWLAQHVVNGNRIAPGSLILCLMDHVVSLLPTANQHATLSDVSFLIPVTDVDNICTLTVESKGTIDFAQGQSRVPMPSCAVGRSSHSVRWSPTSNPVVAMAAALTILDNRPRIDREGALACVQGSRMRHDPCSLDASMHLGLLSPSIEKVIVAEVPVQVDGYWCEDTGVESNAQTSGQASVNKTKYLSARCGNQILVGVHSKPPYRSSGSEKASIRWMVEHFLYEPVEAASALADTSAASHVRHILDGPWNAAAKANGGVFLMQDWHSVLQMAVKSHGSALIGKEKVSLIVAPARQVAPQQPLSTHHTACMMTDSVVKTATLEQPNTHITLERKEIYQSVRENIVVGTSLLSSFVPAISGSHGSSLVTGAFGGIGILTSIWLQIQGKNVLRVGRKVRTPLRRSDYSYQLRNGRALVVDIQGDTGLTSDVDALVGSPDSFRVLELYHSAGILRDGLMQNLQARHIRETVSGKSALFSWIVERLEQHGARSIMAYSSISSILGNVGQLAYTFANMQLNEIAVRRKDAGIHVRV